jgi:hypothetical protein
MTELKTQAREEFENILFESKEDTDSIEHVDDTYSGFLSRIDKLITSTRAKTLESVRDIVEELQKSARYQAGETDVLDDLLTHIEEMEKEN